MALWGSNVMDYWAQNLCELLTWTLKSNPSAESEPPNPSLALDCPVLPSVSTTRMPNKA